MLKKVVIIVVVLIAALLVFAATRPDNFRVQRTASIKAPPEKVFALINDFHRWEAWSPWEKLDPSMKRTFSGAENGKGTAYAWESEGKAGAGRMEITESSAPSKIVIKLDFSKPLEGHNTAEFTLDAKGDTTNVTWAMYGPSPYIAKIMGIFFNMDSMIGKDFETGLGNLKAAAEK
ncbi:SRPBCC family protein [Andreprevotia chitinilytica]|uniref:SRPBCC family protein n=1 Tax=Andreprevotia chitinilytica TaxID=396808 RepID=UPI00055835BF|nr:SRPBCC family protein [Andreprevotia chitinilytica]